MRVGNEYGGRSPSLGADATISATSACVGFCPSARSRSPSTSLGTAPVPRLSNKANASLYSVPRTRDQGHATERKDEKRYVCQAKGKPTCVVTLRSVRTHNNTWRSKRGGIHHGVSVVFVDLRAGGCGRRFLSLGRSVVARCSAPDLAGDQPGPDPSLCSVSLP